MKCIFILWWMKSLPLYYELGLRVDFWKSNSPELIPHKQSLEITKSTGRGRGEERGGEGVYVCVTNSASRGLGWGSRKPYLVHLGTFSVLSGVDMWGLNFELHLSHFALSRLYRRVFVEQKQPLVTWENSKDRKHSSDSVVRERICTYLGFVSNFMAQDLEALGTRQTADFHKNKTATMGLNIILENFEIQTEPQRQKNNLILAHFKHV